MEKDALRARLRTKRAALAAAFRRLSSESIAEHLTQHPIVQQATCLGLYAGLDAPLYEVHTQELHNRLHSLRKTVAYPRVRGDELEFACVNDRTQDMTPGVWNIPEPRSHCPVVSLQQIDLLIVPGLAFTANGERLGMGGGYYDRILAHKNFDGSSIGVCFATFVLPNLPVDAWDQTVDWVATERGISATHSPAD